MGDEIVLLSDLLKQEQQYRQQYAQDLSSCDIVEQFLIEKLLLHQAKVDSLEVSDQQVESELDLRIRYFVNQFGSREKLEEFYQKSIVEIKNDFRKLLKDQLLIRQMQSKITGGIKITPADVKRFFEKIPEDSLPLMNSEVEMMQITVFPEVKSEEVKRVKDRLRGFKTEVENGKDFATLAVLYSEDPGSASNGGELGMVGKGNFVPEFDAVAMSLQDGELSDVFETQFGYHLMQMIERRGEKYNARHILLKPRVEQSDLSRAKQKLDSIRTLIVDGEMSFDAAAARFSDDENTKNNGGLIVNRQTGTPRFEMNQVDPQLFFIIDKLKVGQISDPTLYTNENGEKGFRIVKLTQRTEPHKANLKDDYQVIQDVASQQLRNDRLNEWVHDKIRNTYIKIDPQYQRCQYKYPWFKNN